MPRVKNKRSKRTYKFDINRILKERQADAEFNKKRDELDRQMKAIDDLFEAAVNSNNITQNAISNMVHNTFNPTMYNIPFKEDPDLTKSCIQRLHILSIEGNELEAMIHFRHLMTVNWYPVFHNIQTIFSNWGADLDTLINKPMLKCQINKYDTIGLSNFELILEFISKSILENNGFSKKELLIIAKLTVGLSFDHHFKQKMYAIKKLFRISIETAFHEDSESDIIEFSEELYSLHTEEDLLNTIINVFLPIKSSLMKKMYSYIAFKLYKSLLGITNNINAFPTDINDWFVQNVVDRKYFKKNPNSVLHHIIRLLEHVVIVFDLYQDEQKLNDMYNFLCVAIRPLGMASSLRLVSILDQWRLKLFRLYVNRKNNESEI